MKRDDEITIENINWEPLFIHFERYGEDFVDHRNNYKSYKNAISLYCLSSIANVFSFVKTPPFFI